MQFPNDHEIRKLLPGRAISMRRHRSIRTCCRVGINTISETHKYAYKRNTCGVGYEIRNRRMALGCPGSDIGTTVFTPRGRDAKTSKHCSRSVSKDISILAGD